MFAARDFNLFEKAQIGLERLKTEEKSLPSSCAAFPLKSLIVGKCFFFFEKNNNKERSFKPPTLRLRSRDWIRNFNFVFRLKTRRRLFQGTRPYNFQCRCFFFNKINKARVPRTRGTSEKDVLKRKEFFQLCL
jgi:hypothetical protein